MASCLLSELRCLELRSLPVSPPFPIPAGLLGNQGCTVGSRLLCSDPAHNLQPPQGRSRSVKRTSFDVGTSAASLRCGDAMRTTTARTTATRMTAVSRGDQGRGNRGGRHAPLRTWLHPSWGHLPQASRLVLGWVALSCRREPGLGWSPARLAGATSRRLWAGTRQPLHTSKLYGSDPQSGPHWARALQSSTQLGPRGAFLARFYE